ncbi:MAG: flagellar motor switch protein FliN [Chloroflexi bacterium]|nr:flagellar motor switch protein FliN [Chloroflexota bacterium]
MENEEEGAKVNPAQFASFDDLGGQKQSNAIDLLLDVPLRISVVLGKTSMTIRDVLGLGQGSVVELDKMAGEPVDIVANEKLIARGEVVVVDENFGVRVTDIVTPEKRLNSLR